MLNPTKLLDATQAEWPLLPSLALAGIRENLPLWAIESAQRVALNVQPANMAIYRAHLRRRADQLAALHRRWVVAAVLAVLLAMTVVSTAGEVSLDSLHLGILSAVLSAILLPPLAICNGIAREYVAARALATVLGATIQEAQVQEAN